MLGSEVLVLRRLASSDGAARNPTKCDVISDVKYFRQYITVDVIQSDVAVANSSALAYEFIDFIA